MVNILYCGDANICDGVLVSVLSLLANQSDDLHIYLATADLAVAGGRWRGVDAGFAARLDDLVRWERPGSSVVRIDATTALASFPPTANLSTRFTPLCMLRLYADLFEELVGEERVLYLDNDVLCHGPLLPLYRCPLGTAEIGGVLDRYGRWFFHNQARAWDYLNSGVLLMNLPRMRQTGVLRRCRELCATRRMFMPDQTALNKLAAEKLFFPRCFNEQRRLRDDTRLQHFTTRFSARGLLTVKPWEVERVHEVLGLHAYDDVFDRYCQIRSQIIRDA